MVCLYILISFCSRVLNGLLYLCMQLFRCLSGPVLWIFILVIRVRADIHSHCIRVRNRERAAVRCHFSALRHSLQHRIILHLVVRHFPCEHKGVPLCHGRPALVRRERDVQVQLLPAFRGQTRHKDIVRIAHKILSRIVCAAFVKLHG